MAHQEAPRGKLWLTRADHLRVGSSPPIAAEFGDSVPMGDTMTDEQLAADYLERMKGTNNILSLPSQQRESLSHFLNIWGSELDYYRTRGMDVSAGEALLEQINQTKRS